MARIKYPKPGTPVAVYWEDIQEDSVGDPDSAETAERISFGLYMGKKKKGGRLYLTTTTTVEGWEARKYGEQSGWCAYPVGAVVKLVTLSEAPDLLAPKEPEKEEKPAPEPRVVAESKDATPST
jgi:hypothetical protein